MLRIAASMTAVLILGLAACTSPGSPRPQPVDPQAQKLFTRGLGQLRRGDEAAARSDFEAALRNAPHFVDAHRRLQNVRIRAFERETLHREYEDLMRRHPDSAAYRYLFGRLQHRASEQLEHFRRARDLDPGLFWGHYGEAYALGRLGRRDESEDALDRARRIDPSNPLAWRLEAASLARAKKYELAERSLRRAVEAASTDAELWVELARVQGVAGRKLDQIESLDQALTTDGTGQADDVVLAHLESMALSEPDSATGWLAAERLEKALESRGQVEGPSLFRWARVMAARGRRAPARRLAEEAFERGPLTREMVMALRGFRDVPWGLAFRSWASVMEIDTSERNPRIFALASAIEAFEAAAGTPDDRRALDLLTALRGAGWIDEALVFFEEFEDLRSRRRDAGSSAGSEDGEIWKRAVAIRHDLRRHKRFLAELELFAQDEREQRDTKRRDEGLESFVQRVVERVKAATGQDVGRGNQVRGFAFLGEMLDVTLSDPGSLNGYLSRYNQIFLAGRWAGDAPELMLMTLAAPPKKTRPANWPDDFGYVEILGENVLIAPPENRELGRAFYRTYFLNLDRIQPSKHHRTKTTQVDDATRRRLLAARGLPASGQDERKDISDPLDASLTLLLKTIAIHGELPVLEHVRFHEIGHVRDAASRLPVFGNFIENVMLAMQAGFSSDRLGGILEETAQLNALIDGPAPHLVLSELVDFIPDDVAISVHHRGYRSLLQRFLAALDEHVEQYPSIKKEYRLLHQLHWLSEEEVRRIARSILR